MAVDALLLLLTFALGGVLSRISLCAVAGMQQFIAARDHAGLQRLLLAASAAGAVLLMLACAAPDRVLLPGEAPFHAGIILGGLLLGAGALLNGGCYLGSVLYLGSGNVNFLFTLAGMATGSRLAETRWPGPAAAGLRMTMGAWPLAGLVYARHSEWSYGAVLESLAHARFSAMDWIANLSALLLFAGAVTGARLQGRFRLQPPAWRPAARCLAGGAVMAYGAAQVPGGNDMLLLWAIPGLTLYGTLAYGSMLVAIAAGLGAAAAWPRKRAPGTVN